MENQRINQIFEGVILRQTSYSSTQTPLKSKWTQQFLPPAIHPALSLVGLALLPPHFKESDPPK